MPYDPNDPRLTAYALGELDDNERTEIDTLLESCRESRKAVDEIRAMARLLEDELRHETSPGLAPEQHQVIEGHLARPGHFSPYGLVKWSLAAAVLVCVGLGVYQFSTSRRMGELALAERRAATAPPAAAAPHGGETEVTSLARDNSPKTADIDALMITPQSPVAVAPESAPAPNAAVTDGTAANSMALAPPAPNTRLRSYNYQADARRKQTENISPPGQMTQNDSGAIQNQTSQSLARGGRIAGPSVTNSYSQMQNTAGLGYKSDNAGLANKPAASVAPTGRGTESQAYFGENQGRPGQAGQMGAMGGGMGGFGGDMVGAAGGRRSLAMRSSGGGPPAGPRAQPSAPSARADDSRVARESLGESRGLDTSVSKPTSPAASAGTKFSAIDAAKSPLASGLSAAGTAPSRAPAPSLPPVMLAERGKSADRLESAAADATKSRDQGAKMLPVAPAQPAPSGGATPPAPVVVGLNGPGDPNYFKKLSKENKPVEFAGEGFDKDAPAKQVLEAELKAKGVADEAPNVEEFRRIVDNPFFRTPGNELSTFSVDVDTASYSIVRRFLNMSQMPPPDAARIEEMINYFPYDYPETKGDQPFSIKVDIARCPWNADHRLARIGLRGKEIPPDKRPRSNLVFLVDVSGSMDEPDKLPLVRTGLRMLVQQLTENDRVGIVVYASRTQVELHSIHGGRRAEIEQAIARLSPGGSTNGAAGIVLAYDEAVKNFIPGGTNRVILCTDGDFNVGVTNDGELTRLIESRAKESKVFLSVLGFGTGNLKDGKMEALADKGNGNYAYIDSLSEARKVLIDQMSGTLNTIAKDVKVQVEFNPIRVGAYRLIGYENRMLRAEDFNDDTKDAGEIGAGHTVTALYELVPPDKVPGLRLAGVDELRFSRAKAVPQDAEAELSMNVKLKYKAPDAEKSEKAIEIGVKDEGREYPQDSEEFKFAAAVAEFGLLLRNSPHKGSATFAAARELAESSRSSDPFGYRAEFVELVRKAEALSPAPNPAR
jgi:Ca-activated chloride channel homolog